MIIDGKRALCYITFFRKKNVKCAKAFSVVIV